MINFRQGTTILIESLANLPVILQPFIMIFAQVLRDAFSFEAWGGATFDVCMRFQVRWALVVCHALFHPFHSRY